MTNHPRALLFAVLAASSFVFCSPESREDQEVVRPGGPVIMISIDTLRADRLPAWGYDRIETPAIDSLVRDGVRFSSAWSHVPLTLPSHASIFTGLLPGEHGVRDNLGYRLSPDMPTLASLLQQNGYATAGMVSAWVLREESGIASGFESWDDEFEHRPGGMIGELQRAGHETAEATLRWLSARENDEPFFLFVHLFEPHAPYEPPEPFRSRYSDPYDGEIAAIDAVVQRLLASLRSSGIYDEATIILLSDHGEGLGDHGEPEHGIFLYREAIHVPLVMKLPGSSLAGTTVDEPVQLIDVFPTVLEAAGVEGNRLPQALSLIETATGRGGRQERRVFSESMYPRLHLGWSELTSLTDGEIHVIEAPKPELYRMSEDFSEQKNLVEQERRLYASFRAEIEETATPFAPPAPVNAEEAAKLTALGYLGAGPSGTIGPFPDPKDRIHELQQIGRAWQALRAGREDEAIELYEAVVASNPGLTDAWVQLSTAYEEAGRVKDAIAASQRAVQISPSLAQGLAVTIARLQLQLGDLEGAREHAELAAAERPEESALILGRVALSRGQLSLAETTVSGLMDDESFRSLAAVIVAQAHVRRGDYQRGLDLLDQERSRLVAADHPLPSLMEFARGDALVRLGRIDEGIEAFHSEIERHQGNLDAYSRLAALYVLSGRVNEAEEVMRQLTGNNPQPESYAVAARTFERLGRDDLALKWRARGDQIE